MASKFLNLEKDVSLLLQANASLIKISSILNKPPKSIYNTITRIKKKNT